MDDLQLISKACSPEERDLVAAIRCSKVTTFP